MRTYIGTPKQINKEFCEECKAGGYKLDKKYVCEIKELRGGKTEEQRARYWATLREYTKLKQLSGIDTTEDEEHKEILADLKIYATDSNGDIKYILLRPGTDYKKYMDCHICPTSGRVVNKDGESKQIFIQLKRSEEFNTEEYSRLIERLNSIIIQEGLENEINIYSMP